ncbi:MAG: ferrous iron transport protein A [Clostridia bacterium]|nr:ferrous iron transport protein A [Clostridia bacterium]
MKLSEIPVGKKVRVLQVYGDGPLRRRLLDMGVTPKTEIEVTKLAPMGDPIELFLRGYSLTIRKDEADQIDVEEIF